MLSRIRFLAIGVQNSLPCFAQNSADTLLLAPRQHGEKKRRNVACRSAPQVEVLVSPSFAGKSAKPQDTEGAVKLAMALRAARATR